MDHGSTVLLQKVAQQITMAPQVVFLTGTDLSKEAGIDVLTNEDGSYSAGAVLGRAVAHYGGTVGWVATPGITWEHFIRHYYSQIAAAEPTDAHRALAKLEGDVFGGHMTLLTTAVDGLHAMAGSENAVEVRGSARRFRCTKCARPMRVQKPLSKAEDWDSAPTCRVCGVGSARPDCSMAVTEALPEEAWSKALSSVDTMQDGSVFVLIGTTGTLGPPAGLADRARSAGALIVDIQQAGTPPAAVAHAQLRGNVVDLTEDLVAAILEALEGKAPPAAPYKPPAALPGGDASPAPPPPRQAAKGRKDPDKSTTDLGGGGEAAEQAQAERAAAKGKIPPGQKAGNHPSASTIDLTGGYEKPTPPPAGRRRPSRKNGADKGGRGGGGDYYD